MPNASVRDPCWLKARNVSIDRGMKNAVIVLLLSLPATAWAGDSRLERLADGEIFVETVPVASSEYPQVLVEAVIDAPPKVVWALITSCVLSEKTYGSVMKSFVVRREGETVVCSETVDMPWPIRNLESVTQWTFVVTPNRWVERWTMVDGDFDYIDGQWILTPFGDGTRTHVRWENHFSPQISIPAWLTRAFLKVGMPSMIEDLRAAARARR